MLKYWRWNDLDMLIITVVFSLAGAAVAAIALWPEVQKWLIAHAH